MKRNYMYVLLLALAGLTLTTACDKEENGEKDDKINVSFLNLSADGSNTYGSTSLLTLEFNRPIEGLTADDISLNAGQTGARKGKLTEVNDGVYELTVTDIKAKGTITATVERDGYRFSPNAKSVTAYYTEGVITNKVLIESVETQTGKIFNRNAKGNIDVKEAKNRQIINSIYTLKLENLGLSSLDGIEYFTDLHELFCNGNNLTTFDLSILPNLSMLDCSNNLLTSLDVSPLTNLTALNCKNNILTTLDVSKLTYLYGLICSGNKLTTLKLATHDYMNFLICNDNQIATLNTSKITSLERLDCYSNNLSTLDLSNLKKLTTLNCSKNKLSALDVSMLKFFNTEFNLGSQTNAENTSQELTLSVNAEQNEKIESDKNEWALLNPNVKLLVK